MSVMSDGDRAVDGVFFPCDTCGHRSSVFAKHPEYGKLSFCGHHGSANMYNLRVRGWEVEDRRWEILT